MQFSLNVFRNHFYPLKYKLLADTYWVMKHNKLGQKKQEWEFEQLLDQCEF